MPQNVHVCWKNILRPKKEKIATIPRKDHDYVTAILNTDFCPWCAYGPTVFMCLGKWVIGTCPIKLLATLSELRIHSLINCIYLGIQVNKWNEKHIRHNEARPLLLYCITKAIKKNTGFLLCCSLVCKGLQLYLVQRNIYLLFPHSASNEQGSVCNYLSNVRQLLIKLRSSIFLTQKGK